MTALLTGAPDDIRTADGRAFDVDTYSRMKHGDAAAIDELGGQLAAELVARHAHLVTDDAVPVFPVAFLHVPPSCYFLAEAVLARLNAARTACGLQPGRIVQVHKDSVTHTDYAASSQAEREAELARIGFRLEGPVAGTNLIVIDDVRVTGLAEKTILAALREADPAALILGYVAVCSPELAASPHVESTLNHATVTSILQLVPAIDDGHFHLTIRFLKRALASAELGEFVAVVPRSLVEQMHVGALATGPEFVAGYPAGMAVLEAALAQEAAHV
ncbi:phosphoribosyltransferase family protein [Calidifontibacter terrae]